MKLSDYQDTLPPGSRFHYSTYFHPYRNVKGEWIEKHERGSRHSTWEVIRHHARGMTVAHPIDGSHGAPGGHEHFIDWDTELDFFERI